MKKSNNYSSVKRVSAAVTFDSTVLKDVQNRDEFLSSIQSIVQDTIGFDSKRGDKITVKDFKFIGLKPISQEQQVDENGNLVSAKDSNDSGVDTFAMVQSILKDFSEYFQYLIAAILLFIFIKIYCKS